MSAAALTSDTLRVPPPLRPRVLRRGAALVVVVAVVAFAARAGAQSATAVPSMTTAQVPVAVGEKLVFRATFGRLPAGTARMRVEGVETVRGRSAYHVIFAIDGGVPFFRVHDWYESWIDCATLSSLRHRQEISEGRYKRTTTYEIYPERAEYQKNDEPP